jgi:hypothetical protein
MSTTTTYGTLSGSSYGISISPTTSETRPKTPAGLVVTQAVQTKDGWLGQVIVDKDIVWEGDPLPDGEDAIQAANARVVQAFKAFFADDDSDSADAPPAVTR